jgi:MauM/NapG family ferredoxin protein
MRSLRRAYQVFFLLLFVALFWLTAQGRLKGHAVTLFLDSSALNGLGTILSAGHLAGLMWIGLLILALTLFFGRFFCGWICPMGTLLHGLSFLARPRRTRERIRRNLYDRRQGFKTVLLVALLTAAALGAMKVGWFDPIALLTRSAAALFVPGMRFAWIILLVFFVILGLNLVRPRFWCRYLCPLGALLGVAARFLPGGVVRDEETCTDCGLCSRDCPAACNPHEKTRMAECFVCWNCIEDCPEHALRWRWNAPREKVVRETGLTRRGFFTAAAGGFAAAAVMRADARTGYPARIRPPGALHEPHFLDRCIQCGACMKVCPTGVLRPAVAEAGLAGLWTPVMDMERGYCEYNCTLCTQVCPTGAIRELTIAEKQGVEDGRPVKTGGAFVDRGRCLPWSFGRNCLVCQEVCPVSPKAITSDDVEVIVDGKAKILRRPVVDPDRCIGCGLCQHECPVDDLAAIRVTASGETRAPRGGFYL